MLDIKVSVEATDGGYITDTPDRVADIVYRYDKDFTDEKIEELRTFCRDFPGGKYADKAKVLGWLLESRRELKAGKYNLGQIKIDMFLNQCTEPIRMEDRPFSECEIFREGDKVIMSLRGEDANGWYSAANAYPLDKFLAFAEGSLEAKIGETYFYGACYEEKEEDIA